MLSPEQYREQLRTFLAEGPASYCPLVTSSTQAAEIFLFLALYQLNAAKATQQAIPEAIPFRVAFVLASTAVINPASEEIQVKRFVNSMRTAIYRMRARAEREADRHESRATKIIRQFKILNDGWQPHEGLVANNEHVRCAIVSMIYAEDITYNLLAVNPLLQFTI